MVEDISGYISLLLLVLTLFDMGLFEPSVMGGHHNFVVIALMIMKFGTGIELHVFYTMVTKSLWRH